MNDILRKIMTESTALDNDAKEIEVLAAGIQDPEGREKILDFQKRCEKFSELCNNVALDVWNAKDKVKDEELESLAVVITELRTIVEVVTKGLKAM